LILAADQKVEQVASRRTILHIAIFRFKPFVEPPR